MFRARTKLAVLREVARFGTCLALTPCRATTSLDTTMSLAQRLAWLDAFFTFAVLSAALALWPPSAAGAGNAWDVFARAAVIVGLCVMSFYYSDLYNFEIPHDLPQVFGRLCRALGVASVLLSVMYVVFPRMIMGSNVAPYSLLVTLVALLALRAVVYALAKRGPFT